MGFRVVLCSNAASRAERRAYKLIGLRVSGLGLRVYFFWFRVQRLRDLGFRASGLGFRARKEDIVVHYIPRAAYVGKLRVWISGLAV